MLALLITLLAQPAQEAEPRVFNEPRVYKTADLEVTVYQPVHVDAESLFEAAYNLLGRDLAVGDRLVANLNLLYDRILIYDTPEATRGALQVLAKVDVERPEVAPPGMLRLGDLLLRDYRVRHAPYETIRGLLAPFERHLSVLDEQGNEIGFGNVSHAGGGLLLLRDTAPHVEEMMSLLERFDRPAPQVLASVWVLRGGADGAVPAEMAKSLAQLLPDAALGADARGMLRSHLAGGLELQLELAGATGQRYQLTLLTGPYDETTGALALEQVRLANAGPNGGFTQMFQTSTSVRAGEYAVIGVTGDPPVLLALRLQIVP